MKFHTHGRKLLLTTTAAVAAIAFSPSAMAQDAPAKAAVYQDQNTVLAMVGNRMVTKWEVMRSLERKQKGFIDRFNTLNQSAAHYSMNLCLPPTMLPPNVIGIPNVPIPPFDHRAWMPPVVFSELQRSDSMC